MELLAGNLCPDASLEKKGATEQPGFHGACRKSAGLAPFSINSQAVSGEDRPQAKRRTISVVREKECWKRLYKAHPAGHGEKSPWKRENFASQKKISCSLAHRT
ncbi:MAG: hypothetical protein HFF17_13750 [Oscillospiraceae bacterium]|nr:hypothetical protein [Oscillospiraceae bacterium]